jgi:homoserine dehydrogenase
MDKVYTEGIRGLAQMDVEYALELGYRIKLLAIIRKTEGKIEVRVHPALVPFDGPLATVSGVFNAVMVCGDVVGKTLYYGKGAGREPTASAVVSDVADAARNLAFESERRVPALSHEDQVGELRPMEDICTRYYLRLSLLDEPGMMAQVAQILGEHGISLASVIQKEARAGEHVPVIFLTHEASEGNFRAALSKIDALKEVAEPTVRLRIVDIR